MQYLRCVCVLTGAETVLSLPHVVSSPFLQLCESLEDLLNVNGKLRSEGQAMWTLLGGILGQVPPPSLPLDTHHLPLLLFAPTILVSTHRLVVEKVCETQIWNSNPHGQQWGDTTGCNNPAAYKNPFILH